MSREVIRENNLYYSIIKGTFRTRVDAATEGAVRREYETKDGGTGVKYERIVNSMIGYIDDVQFYDSEFGRQLYITFDQNEKGQKPIIQLSMDGREADNFLKKLPNIDLSHEVCLRPFNFTGREGDEVRGLEVLQEDETGKFKVKVLNYFYDEDKKCTINDFPRPDGNTDNFTKDDWKMYFLQVRKFLINYTMANMVEKIANAVAERQGSEQDRHAPEAEDDKLNAGFPQSRRDQGEVPDDEIPF